MKQLALIFVFALSLSAPVAAAEWQADPNDKMQVRVQDSIKRFLETRPDLGEYFEEAWGYAVFPRVVKIGAMWGIARGKGLVIENDELIGRCSQTLGSLGAQLGAQSYAQVILFRNREVMEIFKQGRVEFEGRASAVALTAGAASDPGFLPDVAIFSLTNGGLMFEAAAGAVKYSFKPLPTE